MNSDDDFDQIQCGLCYNALTEPRLLSCNHAFCTLCLDDASKRAVSRSELPCPRCGFVTHLDMWGVLSLRKSEQLTDLVRLLKSQNAQFNFKKKPPGYEEETEENDGYRNDVDDTHYEPPNCNNYNANDESNNYNDIDGEQQWGGNNDDNVGSGDSVEQYYDNYEDQYSPVVEGTDYDNSTSDFSRYPPPENYGTPVVVDSISGSQEYSTDDWAVMECPNGSGDGKQREDDTSEVVENPGTEVSSWWVNLLGSEKKKSESQEEKRKREEEDAKLAAKLQEEFDREASAEVKGPYQAPRTQFGKQRDSRAGFSDGSHQPGYPQPTAPLAPPRHSYDNSSYPAPNSNQAGYPTSQYGAPARATPAGYPPPSSYSDNNVPQRTSAPSQPNSNSFSTQSQPSSSRSGSSSGGQQVAAAKNEGAGGWMSWLGSSVNDMISSVASVANVGPQLQAGEPAFAHFEITSERAIRLVETWMMSRWFTPARFVESVSISPMLPKFLPFWYFTVTVAVELDGEVENPNPQGAGPGTYVQKIREHYVHFYNEELVMASVALPQYEKQLQSFKDWRPKSAKKPLSQMPPAAVTTLDSPLAWVDVWKQFMHHVYDEQSKRGRSIMVKRGHKLLRSEVHVQFQNLEKRLIYLPVYITNYRYNNVVYPTIVHGISGEVLADRPYGIGAVTRLLGF